MLDVGRFANLEGPAVKLTYLEAIVLAVALAPCLSTRTQASPVDSDVIGHSDASGRMQVFVGALYFHVGNTELSSCTHGLELDEAMMLRTMWPEHTLVMLKGRTHLKGRLPMLDSRTAQVFSYLVDYHGLDRRYVVLQSERVISLTAEPDLAVSIDVFVAFRGLLPNRDFVVRDGQLTSVDSDASTLRLETRPTSACSGARAARVRPLPLTPSRAPADA
jgi:hypothetical protein